MSRWITGVLAAICLAPGAAMAQSLPVKDFLKFPAFKNVEISPSGKYLSVVTVQPKNPERYQLVVLDAASVLAGKPKVLSHFSLREYKLFADVFWVSAEKIAVATAFRYGGFDRPFLDGDLWLVDARKGGQRQLSSDFGGLLSILPGDANAILISSARAPVAYRISVGPGGGFLEPGRGPANSGTLVADNNGEVRVEIGANSKTGEPELFYRDAGSRDWQDKSELLGKTESERELGLLRPICFSRDNKTLFALVRSGNAAGTFGLYRVDFGNDSIEPVYVDPGVDVGIDSFPDVEPFVRSFDGESLVGLRLEPDEIETVALDPDSARIQLLAALSKTFPGLETEIVSHTSDGRESIVKVSGDAVPVTYYLYSADPNPSLTMLFSQTPWIKKEALSPMRAIEYKTRDGLTIHGYLTVPRGRDPRKLPLVVYVHGGPHGERYNWGFDVGDFDQVATQILANHGFAVLAPNFRGSGGYGARFEVAGYRHWGDAMQDDIADAVTWAVSQGVADAGHVCIFGASYGGYSALMSAERYPEMFRCAIGYDGSYDLFVDKSRRSDTARVAFGAHYLDTVLGSDPKQLRAFSPVFNTGSLKAAVLLIHGGRDERSPVKGYHEMVAAIRKHGTPLKTLFEPSEGHGFYKIAHREQAWTEILAFLDQYLEAPSAGGGSATAGTER